MQKVSICIPYHQTPRTAFFLGRLLRSIEEQTFTDYEIILTAEGKMAENTNAAMRKAKGELIKILYMDDYFAHPTALRHIVQNFKKDTQWLVSGCLHQHVDGYHYEDPHSPHTPQWTEDLVKGNNRLGSPSVVTLRNEGHLEFDETLSYLLDCDLYQRYYDTYGPPTLIDDLDIVIGIGSHQMSHTMPQEEKLQEFDYMEHKYGN